MILRLSMRRERCAHAHSLQLHLFIAITYRPAFRPQGLQILVTQISLQQISPCRNHGAFLSISPFGEGLPMR